MDIWHFPRHDLAEYILEGMSRSLLNRVSLFASRKRGKTQFIQKDIIPLCEQKGILAVYIDFWDDKSNPEGVFIQSVITACKQNEPVIRQLKSPMGLSELVMNFYKASVEFGGQSKEIQQYTLFDAFQMLNELQLPVLLCLDEVQHLAKKPEFDNFVASLHDFMVNRSDDLIKGIFIGSSYEGLEKRLRENTAQLYSSEPSIEFKSLDIDFVQFELSMFKKVTGNIELNEKQALDIFIIQQREPARFVEMLKKMVLSGTYDLAEGLANFDQKQEFSAEFEEVHQKLHPIDFGILKLISLDQAGGLYTDEGMRKLLIIVGDESVRVSTSSINNALRRLKKSNILFSPKRGVLAFENQEFETYMNQKR